MKRTPLEFADSWAGEPMPKLLSYDEYCRRRDRRERLIRWAVLLAIIVVPPLIAWLVAR